MLRTLLAPDVDKLFDNAPAHADGYFHGSTLVTLDEQGQSVQKPISEVKKGDFVHRWSEANLQVTRRRVSRARVENVKNHGLQTSLFEVNWVGQSQPLLATPYQALWVNRERSPQQGEWVRIKDLVEGDRVFDPVQPAYKPVLSVEQLPDEPDNYYRLQLSGKPPKGETNSLIANGIVAMAYSHGKTLSSDYTSFPESSWKTYAIPFGAGAVSSWVIRYGLINWGPTFTGNSQLDTLTTGLSGLVGGTIALESRRKERDAFEQPFPFVDKVETFVLGALAGFFGSILSQGLAHDLIPLPESPATAYTSVVHLPSDIRVWNGTTQNWDTPYPPGHALSAEEWKGLTQLAEEKHWDLQIPKNYALIYPEPVPAPDPEYMRQLLQQNGYEVPANASQWGDAKYHILQRQDPTLVYSNTSSTYIKRFVKDLIP
jgi:hypothetical protein